ncbi:MAG: hypothetical protein ACLUAR_01570 [Pilosibacter sp.]
MKKLIALTLSVTMILSLSACGKKEQIPSNNASNNSDNTGKTYSIDIGHGGAESTAQQVGCLALKDYLENNSNGVFTVNVYPSNSVGSDDEALSDGAERQHRYVPCELRHSELCSRCRDL